MINIQPRTYNEALRLSRCTEIRKFAPKITDDIIENMYYFLSADSQNKIGLSNGTIYYVQANGEKTDAYSVETKPGFDHIVLGATFFRVTNTSSDSSGCGCGGCSSNNNNNNNNNNG